MMTSDENPILKLAREMKPVNGDNWLVIMDLWCTEPEEWCRQGEMGIDTTPEQVAHALKVLKKLVEVYWPDDDERFSSFLEAL
jgi:hypothetical protein